MAVVIGEVREATNHEAWAYRQGKDRPLGGYVLVIAAQQAQS